MVILSTYKAQRIGMRIYISSICHYILAMTTIENVSITIMFTAFQIVITTAAI